MADSDNRDDDNRDDDNLQPRLKKRKLQDTEEDENDDVDTPAAAAVSYTTTFPEIEHGLPGYIHSKAFELSPFPTPVLLPPWLTESDTPCTPPYPYPSLSSVLCYLSLSSVSAGLTRSTPPPGPLLPPHPPHPPPRAPPSPPAPTGGQTQRPLRRIQRPRLPGRRETELSDQAPGMEYMGHREQKDGQAHRGRVLRE